MYGQYRRRTVYFLPVTLISPASPLSPLRIVNGYNIILEALSALAIAALIAAPFIMAALFGLRR